MPDHIPKMYHLPEGVSINPDARESCCPTCKQNTLLYPVRLSKVGLRPLWMALGKEVLMSEEVHQQLGKSGYSNFTKLRHWELIEEVDTGVWKISDVGRAFLKGEVKLPERLWIYNGAARIVPEGEEPARMVSFQDVVPSFEISRQSAAQESVRLDASAQSGLGV